MTRPSHILPVIVFAQFAATALWFATNAVIGDLQQAWGLPGDQTGTITSFVQLGFISGTLVFAFLNIADRFAARGVFLVCAIAGALANGLLTVAPESMVYLLASRFATGFFLAGLYPVGMKIAAGWFNQELGKAIGFVVAALVLGTAFPHLLSALGAQLPWKTITLLVSALTISGGLLLYWLVPDGPYSRQGAPFNPTALVTIFRSAKFRSSAFGYFGHMWELYAFWAFLPLLLSAHFLLNQNTDANISAWAFLAIASGSLGCALGGIASQRFGSAKVAAVQLGISGTCCLLSPLMFFAPTPVFLAFILVWGITVVGDSAQFSALNAATAPPDYVGSALTIVTCVGFAISIVSIELIDWLSSQLSAANLFIILALGPALGLVALKNLLRQR